MDNTGVATIDDPGISQGAEQVSTLENFDANVAAELSSQTGESAGAATATTDAPVEPPAATSQPAEGTKGAEAEAKMHRINQDNANLRATITKMGIEPDSDTAEQLRSGLITYDDVLRARQPVTTTTPAAPQATAPEVSLPQKIDNLRSVLNKPLSPQGLTAEEVQDRQIAFLDVIAGQAKEIDNIKQSQAQKNAQEEASRMVAATNDVFSNSVVSELSAEIPEDVRQIAASAFLGATDIENISLIREIGEDRANTPTGYSHSATKVAPNFKKLIQAVYKAGQDSNNPNPNPPVAPTAPRTNIQALRPGGGPTPPPPADKNKYDIENLDANIDDFLASDEGRV